MKSVRQGGNTRCSHLAGRFSVAAAISPQAGQYAPETLAPQRLPCGIFFIYRRKADALTDFLEEVAQRCQFKYQFFGHYHSNRVIRGKYVLLYEQIIKLNL